MLVQRDTVITPLAADTVIISVPLIYYKDHGDDLDESVTLPVTKGRRVRRVDKIAYWIKNTDGTNDLDQFTSQHVYLPATGGTAIATDHIINTWETAGGDILVASSVAIESLGEGVTVAGVIQVEQADSYQFLISSAVAPGTLDYRFTLSFVAE